MTVGRRRVTGTSRKDAFQGAGHLVLAGGVV